MVFDSHKKHKEILLAPKRMGNITMAAEADLPTIFGHFKVVVFHDHASGKEHSAIIKGEISGQQDVPCRIHSECHTGDVLGSLRCDCRSQLETALSHIEDLGRGVVLYLRQEGRGIGLVNKIHAYRLQQEGYDTVEANLELGLPAEARRFDFVADMLDLCRVESIRLMSNNPEKFEQLSEAGVKITGRIPIEIGANPHNESYLRTKKKKMNHAIGGSLELPVLEREAVGG